MPRSFEIALFSGVLLVVYLFLLIIGAFSFDWTVTSWMVGGSLAGFGLSWVVKKVEKIEKNW